MVAETVKVPERTDNSSSGETKKLVVGNGGPNVDMMNSIAEDGSETTVKEAGGNGESEGGKEGKKDDGDLIG